MNLKKALAWGGAVLLLGGGLLMAAGLNGQFKTAQKQHQLLFMDQDGDGICDYYTDHDSDGVPNCQDPDWSKLQEDGTGNRHRMGHDGNAGMSESQHGRHNGMHNRNAGMFGNQHGMHNGQGFSNQSFRRGSGPFGSGVCDGTGPKGQAKRNGKR